MGKIINTTSSILLCILFIGCTNGCKEYEYKRKIRHEIEIEDRKRVEERKKKEEIKKLENEIIAPTGVDKRKYIHYLALFGPEWADYKDIPEKAEKEFKNYFGAIPYRVIWHWDIDGCGYKDFLAVEICPKVRRGIKRGILVDEIGRIKLYIDTIKGVWMPDGWIALDLSKLGHWKGEVECYSIGYIPRYGEETPPAFYIGYPKSSLDDLRRHEKEKPGGLYFIGEFFLQRIDKDNKVIGTEYADLNAGYRFSDYIAVQYNGVTNRVFYDIFIGSFSHNEEYNRKKQFVEQYRKAKKQGKSFSPPTFIDAIHVAKAVRIMKMKN